MDGEVISQGYDFRMARFFQVLWFILCPVTLYFSCVKQIICKTQVEKEPFPAVSH